MLKLTAGLPLPLLLLLLLGTTQLLLLHPLPRSSSPLGCCCHCCCHCCCFHCTCHAMLITGLLLPLLLLLLLSVTNQLLLPLHLLPCSSSPLGCRCQS
jgi:hypothetical protein